MKIPQWLTPQVAVFITVFGFSLILGPIVIPILKRIKFGQIVREDGPPTHLHKTGIPTMGGIIFIIPVVAVCTYLSTISTRMVPVLLYAVCNGLIGFADDLIIVLKKSKNGLSAKQKSFCQLCFAIAFAVYVYSFTDTGTGIMIPFMGMDRSLDISWAFLPLVVLFLYYMVNSVNLADGVDGLASGMTLIVAVFFTITASARPEWDYITLFYAAIAGGCLGFLVFNMHPAKVFMGNTGSYALGGALAGASVMMGMPLILAVAGLVFIMESLSVMIQVTSFKTRGKRIFKMSPLHHHFELSGWKETKVVAMFWLATLVCCILAGLSLL